jgi:Multiple myeloma tumor-associated
MFAVDKFFPKKRQGMGRGEREDKPRPGNRGGLGLFKWESIIKDADKTHYLGNTVKASSGRWTKGKNLNWFHVEKEQSKSVEVDEIAEIKRLERIAMEEALGIFRPADEEFDEEKQMEIERVEKERLVEEVRRSERKEKIIGLGMRR